jgi:sterol desaturase/sphingolipid hydroxylase (fatty acid hydroxylase superfamily)
MNKSFIFVGFGLVLFSVESFWPARTWPQVKGWWIRSAWVSSAQFALVMSAGLAWEGGMSRHRLWSADRLGVVGGAIVGYVAITFVNYWWHRIRHDVPFVWRWLHQMHHSPQRVELITSFYRHPLEIVINSLLMSAVLYIGVGVTTEAAGYAVLLVGLVDMFYHWNVKTPHWLGYIIQRPESHCVHHQEGVHSYNFADLPIWDIIFRTFRNPKRYQGQCGFGGEAEEHVIDMLRGVDWSKAAGSGRRVQNHSLSK